MARRIEVEIVGDSSSLERAFRRSSAAAGKFNRDVSRSLSAGRKFSLGLGLNAQTLGAAGIGLALKKSVDAASDLNEQIGKTDVVFGKSAEQVKAWSETTTQAFGLSQRAALSIAGTFGALLRPVGLTGQAAADQSEKLTELGSDLASFYNTDVQDALDAVRSGIVGEAEPLRKYGVLLSETRVQQEALRETGKKHASDLTQQEKVLARIHIIYGDTKQAQGDFARSSDRLAGQTKTLTANFEDLEANLGQALIPTVGRAMTAMNEFFEVMKGPSKDELTKGSQLETTLVPALAKQIERMQKAGKTGKEILATLRARIGTAGNASDIIAEAFALANKTDPALAARIKAQVKKQAEDAVKAAAEAVADAKKKAPAAGQRNTWFDALIGDQRDRAQDLPLRQRLRRLSQIAKEVQARLADTKDPTRRRTLEAELRDIARERRGIEQDITDQKKQQVQAVKDQIDAQQRLADTIKSAALDQLQRQQTGRENQRAIADAAEQLRLARAIGGPHGIQAAARNLADAQFAQRVFGLQAAPATLRGGQFAFGGITINIHGVTDPDEVARKVVAAIERRRRHTSTTSRGPAAGTSAGNR